MGKMKYHKNFDKYVEAIVSNKNYEGLYVARNDKNNRVKWVAAGSSVVGEKRLEWWKEKCKEYGIPLDKGCYGKVVRMIHPTSKHVCQCCGKELSINYEYPQLPTLKKINKIIDEVIKQTTYTIGEIIDKFASSQELVDEFATIFKQPKGLSKDELRTQVYENHVNADSSYFSPGVMSNCPDRFDGLHSYGLCCRKIKDKGRHDSNMKTYAQDRRAYEEWADGDWNLANHLMGEFNKQPAIVCPKCNSKGKRKMTADHIGPISLGFCHSKHFAPLCRSCNSSKNNRLSKSDVDQLVQLEDACNTVISWHSKHVWDYVKGKVTDDNTAKIASDIMNVCHKNVLYLFYLIYSETGEDFLKAKYLHPDYAYFDHKFKNLDLTDLSKLEIKSTKKVSKNKEKNEYRYIRIAFESLNDLGNKKNRKVKYYVAADSDELNAIVNLIQANNFDEADKAVNEYIVKVADEIIKVHNF